MENKTDYQISSSVHEGIVEIVITGELTSTAFNKLHVEAIEIIRELNAKAVLCDIRALKGPHEFGEAYFRVRNMPQDIKSLSAAIVELPNDKAYQSFHEDAAANVGWPLKWFTDIDAARAWLKSKL
jgi:hypothetical protein